MTKKQNIIDKIWDAHVVHHEDGAPDVFFIDMMLIHEVTSPQAFTVLREKEMDFAFRERNYATLDHSIPTDSERKEYGDDMARKQVEKLRENCEEFEIPLFDFGSGGQGIVHVIGPELGLTQPGKTIVCGDSHTSTHGAFGALAFGIGTTQISHVMATQTLLLEKPKTMKVEFVGTPTKHFTAKDAILALIAQIGIQGGNAHAMEFCGPYIQNLSMEGRMTMCNMSIEGGAKFGLISPDATTIEWLRGRKYSPLAADGSDSDAEAQMLSWASSEDSAYDTVVTVDLEGKKPYVTWGTNPEQGIEINQNIPVPEELDEASGLAARKALEYNGLTGGAPIAGTPIDYVFIGSCTNSRMEDLRAAAEVMKDQKVADNATFYIVPGSEGVREQAIKEGLDQIFDDAGAQFRYSGCSMCLAMNDDKVPVGKRCASTSNRNFVGRQGQGSFTHLMSPQMAALAAIHGEISAPIN